METTCCYRAFYDPEDGEWVHFIVPGHGACKTKLGIAVEFTPDSGNPHFRVKRLSGSLDIKYVRLESLGVLTNLLELVTCGLQSLSLCADAEDPATTAILVDLCTLATACPELRNLHIAELTIVVSAQGESFRRWPIKTVSFRECPGALFALTECLRNRMLRMARELVKLRVTARRHEFDEEEERELKAHDGEFLAVTKERFPTMSKATMISVVLAASSMAKPIHRLDAYILSLIFEFASTPEQRSVECWSQARSS